MFAVIKTGGKQYRVAANQILRIEKLTAAAGDLVTFGEVLMLGDGNKVTIGSPLIAGASVAAELVEQARGPKLIAFKKKRRHNYRRKRGHRQPLSLLRVVDILTDGKTLDASAKDAAKSAALANAEKSKASHTALTATTGAKRKAAVRKAAPKAAAKSAGKKPAAKKKAASKKSEE